MYSSTCFDRPHSHYQELNNCSSSLWLHCWSVVVAVLLIVVGPDWPDHDKQHCYHHVGWCMDLQTLKNDTELSLSRSARNFLADQVTISFWGGFFCIRFVIECPYDYKIHITKCKNVYDVRQSSWSIATFRTRGTKGNGQSVRNSS